MTTTPEQQPAAPLGVLKTAVIQADSPPIITADGTPRGPVGVVWPQQQEANDRT